jgi:putative transposase
MGVLSVTALFVRALLVPRLRMIAENLALRQQLATYHASGKRPKLKPHDRLFWVLLRCFWSEWRSVLVIVQPETVVRWHRLGFHLYWRWKSTWGKPGRPKVARELRDLIRRMSRENMTWGAPRIAAELRLLGYEICDATVAKYMVRVPKPPSQTWKTFLANHAQDIAAIDFFTMPTATFRVLYCFVVIRHDSRRVVHFNVTEHPTAVWTGQQIANAFPYDEAPRFLLRDNDGVYGDEFSSRVESMNIDEVKTAYRSPWQNPYAERVISSIRRECLDHMIILSEDHLRRVLAQYFEYYHVHRAHQGLDGDAPLGRKREPLDDGPVRSIPFLGGLHHRYTRQAA